MSEKKLIVPLVREPKAKKSKPARNHLLLSLNLDSILFFAKIKAKRQTKFKSQVCSILHVSRGLIKKEIQTTLI